jgi:hypothetical protein
MESPNNSKKYGLLISFVVVVLVAAVAVLAGKDDDDNVVQQPTPSVLVDNEIYKNFNDGVYSATGSYMSPGGKDEIDVNLTLKDNVIADINATAKPGDDVSKKYMKMFTDNYKSLVVGKNISELKLDKVSGSSLTSIGFNDAINQIRVQAKI